jgi:hypothetical protein
MSSPICGKSSYLFGLSIGGLACCNGVEGDRMKPRLYMIALWFGLLLLFAAWALGWLR